MPDAVPVDEVWRFSTSTAGWEGIVVPWLTTSAGEGVVPRGRAGHVMVSVGLDLWFHGGSTSTGEGDVGGIRAVLLLLLLR